MDYINLLHASGMYEKQTAKIIPFRSIDIFENAVSAGTGNFLVDGPKETVRIDESILPEDTTFGVRISGDSICPVICIIIRYLLKPFIYAKLQMNNYYGEIITEYLTNYMCFIVLSVEIFSILFTFGVVKSVVVLLFVDTAIFIGLLVVGLVKMDLRGKEVL